MELENTIRRFKDYQKKLKAYQHATGLLYYDSVTTAPSGASEALGETLGMLSEEIYKLSVAPELAAMLAELLAHRETLDRQTRREAEKMEEDRLKTACLPQELYVDYQKELNTAQYVWHKAKAQNDYALFVPHLEKLIVFAKQITRLQHPDEPILYNALLDEYEKGLTVASLDAYFAEIKKTIVPLLKAVQASGRAPREDFLHRIYPVEKQKELSAYVMHLMGLDDGHCALGETEHPFTLELNKNDVRITTKYKENEPLSNLYSVVHEGGHALYETHLADSLTFSYLSHGTSMGVHESQSRFFENVIGRSQAFCSLLFPEMQKLFPQQLADVTAEEFYRAANKAEATLIRTEADELTYSLHILIRYEIEKKIFADELSVAELPAEWNRLYKEYLGLDVPDDTHGILQDSHWSGGSFGYFPSYSIGSAYAAQITAAMAKELDVPALVQKGELAPIVGWLTERIYHFGAVIDPAEVLENCCHQAFDPSYYTRYLSDKFTALYGLSL